MKKLVSLFLILAMIFTLIGCNNDEKSLGDNGQNNGGTVVTDENKGLDVLGDTLKYNPNVLINNGQPITIDFWTWEFVDIYKNLIDQYQEIHPNVKINLIETPWGLLDQTSFILNSKDSPALFAIHNSYHDNLINYMAPYEMSLDDLRQISQCRFYLIDGDIYYLDYAMMTANIYYNKDMWKKQV